MNMVNENFQNPNVVSEFKKESEKEVFLLFNKNGARQRSYIYAMTKKRLYFKHLLNRIFECNGICFQ